MLVNAMALWIDQLFRGTIRDFSLHTNVYNGTFIITIVVGHHHILLLGRR